MTTIVAKVNDDGTVTMAWDSQVTTGRHATSINHRKGSVVNGQVVMATAGRALMSNIVQNLRIPEVPASIFDDESFDPEKWIHTDLIPRLIQDTADFMDNVNIKSNDDWAVGETLVGMKGHIFKIDPDFTVIRMGKTAATGSGGDWALAALDFNEPPARAVEYAITKDLFTGGTVTQETV